MKATLQTSTYFDDRRVASASCKKTQQNYKQTVVQPGEVLASIKMSRGNGKLSIDRKRPNSNQAQKNSPSPETKDILTRLQLQNAQMAKQVKKELKFQEFGYELSSEDNRYKNMRSFPFLNQQKNSLNTPLSRINQKMEQEQKEDLIEKLHKQTSSASEYPSNVQQKISPRENSQGQIERKIQQKSPQMYNKGDISQKIIQASKFIPMNFPSQTKSALALQPQVSNKEVCSNFNVNTFNSNHSYKIRKEAQGNQSKNNFEGQSIPKLFLPHQYQSDSNTSNQSQQQKDLHININLTKDNQKNLNLSKDKVANELLKLDKLTKDPPRIGREGRGTQFVFNESVLLNPIPPLDWQKYQMIGSQDSARQYTICSPTTSTRQQTHSSQDSTRQQTQSQQDSLRQLHNDYKLPFSSMHNTFDIKNSIPHNNDQNQVQASGNTTAAFLDAQDSSNRFKNYSPKGSRQVLIKEHKDQHNQIEGNENSLNSSSNAQKPFALLFSNLFSQGNSAKKKLGIPDKENKAWQESLTQLQQTLRSHNQSDLNIKSQGQLHEELKQNPSQFQTSSGKDQDNSQFINSTQSPAQDSFQFPNQIFISKQELYSSISQPIHTSHHNYPRPESYFINQTDSSTNKMYDNNNNNNNNTLFCNNKNVVTTNFSNVSIRTENHQVLPKKHDNLMNIDYDNSYSNLQIQPPSSSNTFSQQAIQIKNMNDHQHYQQQQFHPYQIGISLLTDREKSNQLQDQQYFPLQVNTPRKKNCLLNPPSFKPTQTSLIQTKQNLSYPIISSMETPSAFDQSQDYITKNQNNLSYLNQQERFPISGSQPNLTLPNKSLRNNCSVEETLPILSAQSDSQEAVKLNKSFRTNQYSMNYNLFPNNNNNSTNSFNENSNSTSRNDTSLLQDGLQDLFTKMKKKLIHFQKGEKEWKNEKSYLLMTMNRLQNEMDSLKQENQQFKNQNANNKSAGIEEEKRYQPSYLVGQKEYGGEKE